MQLIKNKRIFLIWVLVHFSIKEHDMELVHVYHGKRGSMCISVEWNFSLKFAKANLEKKFRAKQTQAKKFINFSPNRKTKLLDISKPKLRALTDLSRVAVLSTRQTNTYLDSKNLTSPPKVLASIEDDSKGRRNQRPGIQILIWMPGRWFLGFIGKGTTWTNSRNRSTGHGEKKYLKLLYDTMQWVKWNSLSVLKYVRLLLGIVDFYLPNLSTKVVNFNSIHPLYVLFEILLFWIIWKEFCNFVM